MWNKCIDLMMSLAPLLGYFFVIKLLTEVLTHLSGLCNLKPFDVLVIVCVKASRDAGPSSSSLPLYWAAKGTHQIHTFTHPGKKITREFSNNSHVTKINTDFDSDVLTTIKTCFD